MDSCNSDNDACCEENEAECSYLVPEVELSELTNGDKSGSTWLVVNDKYIFHKNDVSLDEEQVYWVCSKRKQTK